MQVFKKYYLPQMDENDCGIACLAMILKYYGSNVSLSYLRNLAKTNLEGTTALGLVKAAQELNLKTDAYQTDMALFEQSDLTYPFIAHVIKQATLQHYYLVLGANEDYIQIADPDETVGIKKMPKSQFEKEWTGVALFFEPTSNYQAIHTKEQTLLALLLKLVTHRGLILTIVLVSLLMTLTSILNSYFLQVVIDRLIPTKATTTLTIIACGLLIAYVFNSLFLYIREFSLTILGQRLSVNIVLSYVRHVLKLPMEFVATHKTGDILARFTDSNKIIDALASTVISMFLDVGTVLVIGWVLALQNLRLFGLTLLAIPLYVLVIFSFTSRFEKLNRQVMESNSLVSASIIENIQGIETLKALNSERVRYHKIDKQFKRLLSNSLNYVKVDTLQQAIKIFIQALLTTLILWYGANLVITDSISLGQLMAYNALLSYFLSPLQNIINLQTKLQSAQVANKRLNEIFYIDSEFKLERPITDSQTLVGPIKFQHLSYSYGYGKNTLTDINLTIQPNEKLTIVGMSGSGKSTLVKLLINFYEATSGNLTFNQQNISEIDKHTLRSYVRYIPQEPVVFAGTILDNLLLGSRPNLSEAEILTACEIAQIKEDILKMPLQFQTRLDEHGGILSGGQKQRLTIARALLSSAKVLIFDESTSGLDVITERLVIDRLLSLKDKTIIFVAHRLLIAKKTNNIAVLKDGHLVEQGTHEQLIGSKGYYHQLISDWH